MISDFRFQISDFRILDVGTGNGVIALSLAAKFPDAEVHAVDVSDDALALARENAARLGLSERVRFAESDLLDAIEGDFDLIVANLPYVSTQDRQSLSREVLHDPEMALFAGERGDEIIRQLIEQARARLRTNGLLALEIGLGQSVALSVFLSGKNYHDIESKTDYSGIPRFLFARYG
jgi:release factor glutamine methyltransferase